MPACVPRGRDYLEIHPPSSHEQFFGYYIFIAKYFIGTNIHHRRVDFASGEKTTRFFRDFCWHSPTRRLPNVVVLLLWYAIHGTTREKETVQKQRTVKNFSYCIIMRNFAGRGHGHRRRRWTVDRRNTLSPHQRPFCFFFPRSLFAQTINNNFLVVLFPPFKGRGTR